MFIALEGIDGSGTTTQAQALRQALENRGLSVTCTAQPSTGSMGKLARSMLGDHESKLPHRGACLALTFAGDRLDHYDRVIAPALAQGDIVLCDRYLLSSWVYQSLDLPLDWVMKLNHFAPWPDLTLFLDLDAHTAHARVNARSGAQEIYDRLDLQKALAQSYRELAASHADRNIVSIPGDAPIQDLCETLLHEILARHAQIQAQAPTLGTK